MNLILEAAWQLHQVLDSHHLRYALIGGVAVQFWGPARQTADVDAAILVELGREAHVAGLLADAFEVRRPDAVDFSLRHRVLLLRARGLCDLDISFALPGFEEQVMDRAVNLEIGPERSVRICSAEDLVIYKCVAARPQDTADVRGILIRQRGSLDLPYIRRWLQQLAELADRPEIIEQFESVVKRSSRLP